MKKCAFLLLAAGRLALAATAAANTPVVNILDKTEPTRSEAIGGASTAIGRDATLISVNPAAAAQITRPSLTLAGQRGLFGEVLGQMVLASPLSEGVMAFGAAYYDTGTVKVFTSDDRILNLRMQSDFMGSLTYSRAISPAWAVGGTVKGINSRMMEEASSAAFAFDLGTQFRVTPLIKAGLSVQNVGTKLRYLEDEFSLPAAARGGLAAGIPVANGRDLVVLATDADYAISGAEYQWNGMASLRGGFRKSPAADLAALAFGAGLVFQQYRLDYSVRIGKEFDTPQTLSLTMDFPSSTNSAQALASPAPVPAALLKEAGSPRDASALPAPSLPPAVSGDAIPLTAPEILPGAPAPLPMAPAKGAQKGKSSGMADDLNRELDELLKQTGEKK